MSRRIPIFIEDFWHDDFSNWHRTMFYTYVQLQEGSSGKLVSEKIAGTIKDFVPRSSAKVFLQPIKDVHLHSDFEADLDNYNQGSGTLVLIFSLTAMAILLIACINFMNEKSFWSESQRYHPPIPWRIIALIIYCASVKSYFGRTFSAFSQQLIRQRIDIDDSQ